MGCCVRHIADAVLPQHRDTHYSSWAAKLANQVTQEVFGHKHVRLIATIDRTMERKQLTHWISSYPFITDHRTEMGVFFLLQIGYCMEQRRYAWPSFETAYKADSDKVMFGCPECSHRTQKVILVA